MAKRETRTTSYILASGVELHVRHTNQQIALQLRQPSIADTGSDTTAGVQSGTPLTLSECVELMQTLLAYTALRVGELRDDTQPS